MKALSSAIFCNINEIAWLYSGLDVLTLYGIVFFFFLRVLYGIVDEFVLHVVFTIKSDIFISVSKET